MEAAGVLPVMIRMDFQFLEFSKSMEFRVAISRISKRVIFGGLTIINVFCLVYVESSISLAFRFYTLE
jgi:hypothetical protein